MDAIAREVPRGRQRFREVHRNLKAEVRSFPLHVVGGDVQIASAVCEVILKVYGGARTLPHVYLPVSTAAGILEIRLK